MPSFTRGQSQVKECGSASDIQSIVKNLVVNICSSEDFINTISESLSVAINQTFEKRLSSLEAENEVLKGEVSKANQRVATLSHRVNWLEKCFSNRALRVYGIPETPKEDTMQVAVDLISDKVGVKLGTQDIEECYRIGGPKDGNTRAVYVRLVRHSFKCEIYKNKSKLKGSKIYIREELTRSTQDLVKRAVNKFGTKNVWTNNGLIFARGPDKKVVKILKEADLEDESDVNV